MLKKIGRADVRRGMFVHALGGSWLDHPFWRSKFLLTAPEDVQKLQNSNIPYVIIDDERGEGAPELAVQGEHVAVAFAADGTVSPARLHSQPTRSATMYCRPDKPMTGQERAVEIRKARSAIRRSKGVVSSLFNDARLGKAINIRKIGGLVEAISQSVDRDASIILNIARLKTKDEYTYLHSVAVCALMINLARQLNLDEALHQDIGAAGLLHDVGKMMIPDNILLKPGKLDEAEFVVVRNHPEAGHKILSQAKDVSPVALDVCLHHHEKVDGTGYPMRLGGEDISLVSRMAAVCDVYDAITSQRPYNTPMPPSEALARMQSWHGHFDQLVLSAFVKSLGIYPKGSLVRLAKGQLALVIGNDEKDFTRPIVIPFMSVEDGVWLGADEAKEMCLAGHEVESLEEPADWGFEDWAAVKRRIEAKQG